jgi:hypothetical protein
MVAVASELVTMGFFPYNHQNSVLDARLMSSHGGRLYPEERTAPPVEKPSPVSTGFPCR